MIYMYVNLSVVFICIKLVSSLYMYYALLNGGNKEICLSIISIKVFIHYIDVK